MVNQQWRQTSVNLKIFLFFFRIYSLITDTSIIGERKLLMTCLQLYTLSKNNIHFEKNEVSHSSTYSNVYKLIFTIRVFLFFLLAYTNENKHLLNIYSNCKTIFIEYIKKKKESFDHYDMILFQGKNNKYI
jgi:hypothetical protein